MKKVKIVRAACGNEEAAAVEIADFYNEMTQKGARTSRTIVTAAGSDVVYTMFADIRESEDPGEDIDGSDDGVEDDPDDDVDDFDTDDLEDADDGGYDV